MEFRCCIPLIACILLGVSSLSQASAQIANQPQGRGDIEDGTPRLKLIKAPIAPYPNSASEKGIEGKVVLRILVDAKGRVSDAKAVTGPPALFQAAIESVKNWEFEPPIHAPVAQTAEVWYGVVKDCPGPESDHGEVGSNERLLDKAGRLIAEANGENNTLPTYLMRERKAGVAGTMVLSITLDTEGNVKDIRVVNSLSPRLDKSAMDTVRTWKFKFVNRQPDTPLADLLLDLMFRPTCDPHF